MNREINVLIADDHPIFLQGLKQVIESAQNINIVGTASDGETALRLIEEINHDIAILDINMPGMSGLDVAKAVRERSIAISIIFLTMYKEEDLFNEAMEWGVMGYVLKENAVSEIVNAVNTVSAGNYYISPSISGYLVNRKMRADELTKEKPGLEKLTATERKILRLIVEGKTSKEIAAVLFVSYKTVENHRTNICNKIEIHGSHALLKFAFENKSRL